MNTELKLDPPDGSGYGILIRGDNFVVNKDTKEVKFGIYEVPTPDLDYTLGLDQSKITVNTGVS